LKHTPPPYKFKYNGYFCDISAEVGETGEKDTFDIAGVWDGSEIPGRSRDGKANAAFIVRACNAHDELLSACLGMRGMLEGMGQPIPAMLENAITIGQGGSIPNLEGQGLDGSAS
jgi:hypothetical protein